MKERIRTLSNGVRVANFSSPHHFEFDDGTELSRVSKSTMTRLMLDVKEDEVSQRRINGTVITDIQISFTLTNAIRRELKKWMLLHEFGIVDVVIVPLPVMQCIKAEMHDVISTPFRCVRVANREDKIIFSDKFTL